MTKAKRKACFFRCDSSRRLPNGECGVWGEAPYKIWGGTTTLNNIRGWFKVCGLPESDLHSVRVCASGVGYFRYLTHKDNPEKAQYKSEDIRIFNDYDEIFKKFANTDSDKVSKLVRIFQIVDELNTISFHNLIQYLMLNERDLFKMITSSSALAICVKEYQRSLEYDLKNGNFDIK